ncbi:MAG: sugar ABC transporter substrate-binding protein [Acidobacteria bacterium]|nr:MAG: sugar ABC transporter substrate-binding protein [Acidobacteriota bacterium]
MLTSAAGGISHRTLWACCLALIICLFARCNRSADNRHLVGIAFETLQTEYWVASFEAIKDELAKRDMEAVQAISDHDPNRQLQQVQNYIARGVAGIILVPKDAQTAIP